MKLLFDLNDWIANEPTRAQLLDGSLRDEYIPENLSAELYWSPQSDLWESMQLALAKKIKVERLYGRISLIDPKTDVNEILEFCSQNDIHELVLQESYRYLGDNQSLAVKLSKKIMDTEKWKAFNEQLHDVKGRCQAQSLKLLISNHAGTILENFDDLDKIETENIDGFLMNIPHFLYVNANLNRISEKYEQKIHGIRLGSYNPCAWVAARQNQSSWEQARDLGVFTPFQGGHQTMLGKYIRLIEKLGHQMDAISLVCDANPEHTLPIEFFKSAKMTFETLFPDLSLNEQKAS